MGTEYLSLIEQSARPSDYDQFPKSVIFSYRETEKSKNDLELDTAKIELFR